MCIKDFLPLSISIIMKKSDFSLSVNGASSCFTVTNAFSSACDNLHVHLAPGFGTSETTLGAKINLKPHLITEFLQC